MSEQTIFRVHRNERDRFTNILNETICDERISFRATGLLIYLLSKPQDWKVRQSQLSDAKKEGRDATIAAFNELREHGYITKELIREKGRIIETVWNVYESSQTTTSNRLTEKPETVQPEAGNPLLQRTEDTKNVLSPAKSSKSRCSVEELRAYAVEQGQPESDGEAMFDKWQADGWRTSTGPLKDWQAGFRYWQRNGYLPSQKIQRNNQNGKTYTNPKSVTASSANAGTSNATQARRY